MNIFWITSSVTSLCRKWLFVNLLGRKWLITYIHLYQRRTLSFTYLSRTFNYTPFTNVQKFFLFRYIIYHYLHTCICRYLLITYLRSYLLIGYQRENALIIYLITYHVSSFEITYYMCISQAIIRHQHTVLLIHISKELLMNTYIVIVFIPYLQTEHC